MPLVVDDRSHGWFVTVFERTDRTIIDHWWMSGQDLQPSDVDRELTARGWEREADWQAGKCQGFVAWIREH